MSRRVFLHIGTPKSGTSYLQDRLGQNRDLLGEQGLTFPLGSEGGHFLPALDLIQERWAGELERAGGQWDALVAEASRAKGDVLISHEILAAASPTQVARAMASFAGDEVHLVLTARDLARQLPAEWQEQVKHRSGRRFARFIDAVQKADRHDSELWFWRVQSIPDVLSRWSAGLPPAQVHVVTVPGKGSGPDVLWERYLSVLGLDPSLPYAEASTLNASIGAAEVATLRRLNLLLRKQGVGRRTYVHSVREFVVRDVFAARKDSEPARLPVRFQPFVDEVTQEWLEWLRGSQVAVVGDLDDLTPDWSEADDSDPDQVSDAEVADAAIEALAAVIAAQEQQQSDGLALRVIRRLRP